MSYKKKGIPQSMQNKQKVKAVMPIASEEEESEEIQDTVMEEGEDSSSYDQEEGVEDITDVDDDLFYDPSLFHPANSVGRTTERLGAGAVSLVMTAGNGNRLSISAQIMEELGDPVEVQVQIHGDSIAIATEFPDPSFSYPVKRTGKKGVIYTASLVREIAEALNLDFEGRTTITLYRHKVISCDGIAVAVVKQ